MLSTMLPRSFGRLKLLRYLENPEQRHDPVLGGVGPCFAIAESGNRNRPMASSDVFGTRLRRKFLIAPPTLTLAGCFAPDQRDARWVSHRS